VVFSPDRIDFSNSMIQGTLLSEIRQKAAKFHSNIFVAILERLSLGKITGNLAMDRLQC
jgi:hypothetical protein